MIKKAVIIGNLIKNINEIAKFYDDINDGGCSNLDSCIIKFENPKKIFIEIISEISGIPILKIRDNTYLIAIDYGSQGYRRTKKAEAISHYLKSNGLSTFVEYNID